MTRRLLAAAALAAVAAAVYPAGAQACQPDYCPPPPITCHYQITQKLCPAPVY